MYRIHFDYKTGFFVVQFMVLSLFWRTVREGVSNTQREFSNYDAAHGWVKQIGLDKAYHEQNQRASFHSQLVAR